MEIEKQRQDDKELNKEQASITCIYVMKQSHNLGGI